MPPRPMARILIPNAPSAFAVLVLGLVMSVSACVAQAADDKQDTAPVEEMEEQPAAAEKSAAAAVDPGVPVTSPLANDDPQADQWLTRIEERSDKLISFRAKVRYDVIRGLERDRQRRIGTLLFTPGPPARFRAQFTRLIVDDRAQEQDRRYIFDGQWLVERLGDQKLFIKRQIVPPDSEPGQTDPLRLGEGPFSLPITLKKAEILRQYKVTMVASEPTDPAGTVRLRFIPRAGRRTNIEQIDVWYQNDTLLPVRAVTLDDSENESVVDLTDSKIDEPYEPSDFEVAEPKEAGWRIEIKPWEP